MHQNGSERATEYDDRCWAADHVTKLTVLELVADENHQRPEKQADNE
jgi:hypothetical protein